MRIKFVFLPEKGNLRLPVNYNYILQSMIYRNITQKLSSFLHDKGFAYEKRRFKMFTFSRLFGKYRLDKEKKMIEFTGSISFYLSTPYTVIAEEFTESLLKLDSVKLYGKKVFLSSVEVFVKKVNSDEISIKMLSPLTIYSTLKKNDGGKKTYYYSPFEPEFSELIKRNIIKKYIAFYGKSPEKDDFEISPIFVSERKNLITTIYKGFVIKAWTGIYRLKGSKELILFSYDAGLGGKNSQGFGMWEEYLKAG